MDISITHSDAVNEAIRVPALNARLALLVGDATNQAQIDLYGTTKPTPGDPPGASPIVSIPMTQAAGSVDEENYQLVLDTPIEGQVTGADPSTGSIPVWARVLMPDGNWWADCTVSVAGGGGEVEAAATTQEGDPPADVCRLYQGAYARITTFVIQG